jgi:hypothetical protein
MTLGFFLSCTPNPMRTPPRGSSLTVADGKGDDQRLLYEAFGITENLWVQFIDRLGREPLRGGEADRLNRAVCFEDQQLVNQDSPSAGASCPKVQSQDTGEFHGSISLTQQYWQTIGFNPKKITLGQWKEALALFQMPEMVNGFSLVEPAKGIKQKARVCVKLVSLYQEYRSAKFEPDCRQKVRKMSQLVMNPRTYETLIRGSEIVHVAAKAADLFFPNKPFAQEIIMVNGVNRCVVMPAHHLTKGIQGMSRALGDSVLKNDL